MCFSVSYSESNKNNLLSSLSGHTAVCSVLCSRRKWDVHTSGEYIDRNNKIAIFTEKGLKLKTVDYFEISSNQVINIFSKVVKNRHV